MRVFTKIQMEWDGEKYVTDLLNSEWYEHEGQVALCKGASPDEVQSLADMKNLSKTLSADLATTFGAQQGILNMLNGGWAPVFKAGINQYGFNPAEDAALRTQADTGVAANYAQAKTATNEAISAIGGGNQFLPSGTTAQINAENARAAAGTRSAENLGITEAGYAQGRQNFLAAANALSGVASQENPTAYSGQAISANENVFSMADQINKENQAASPWGAVGGILGGVAGSFLGPIGASLGSKVGSLISGEASGSGDSIGGPGTALWTPAPIPTIYSQTPIGVPPGYSNG